MSKKSASSSSSETQQNQQKPRRHAGGMPKGHVTQKTIAKEVAREALRQQVLKHMGPMVQRMVVAAMGFGHLYTRDKNGKFNKVENQAEIDRLLADGDEDRDYWIFTKDPSVQAFTDLMNRAIDKPKEQPQELDVTLKVDMAERLRRARARAHARNRQ